MDFPPFIRKLRKTIELSLRILRRHRMAVYAHPMSGIYVRAGFIPDISATTTDEEIAERLLRSYSLAVSDKPGSFSGGRDDVWTAITQQQRPFIEILESKNPKRLASYLCNMSRHEATHGTVQGAVEYQHLKRSASYRRYVARMAKDKLVSLAEAVGVLPCENPEQGPWNRNARIAESLLVEKIEQTVGISIAPPAIDGGLFKIGQDPYRFHERDCNAIYTAWLMRDILSKDPSASVCEIGGGVGRVAYWSAQFAIKNYTIIDLPHINVLQGFYLIKSLPRAVICLYGEDRGKNDGSGVRIHVMPSHALNQLPQNSTNLILNQDSFPEINPTTVNEYLAWVKSYGTLFLSINHESKPSSVNGTLQNSVPELIANLGGFVRRSRQLYWLRKGYVCELYESFG
jgi:hypothetical protein